MHYGPYLEEIIPEDSAKHNLIVSVLEYLLLMPILFILKKPALQMLH